MNEQLFYYRPTDRHLPENVGLGVIGYKTLVKCQEHYTN